MKTKTLLETPAEVIDGFAQGGVIPANVRMTIGNIPKIPLGLDTDAIEISSSVTLEALLLEMFRRLGVKHNR